MEDHLIPAQLPDMVHVDVVAYMTPDKAGRQELFDFSDAVMGGKQGRRLSTYVIIIVKLGAAIFIFNEYHIRRRQGNQLVVSFPDMDHGSENGQMVVDIQHHPCYLFRGKGLGDKPGGHDGKHVFPVLGIGSDKHDQAQRIVPFDVFGKMDAVFIVLQSDILEQHGSVPGQMPDCIRLRGGCPDVLLGVIGIGQQKRAQLGTVRRVVIVNQIHDWLQWYMGNVPQVLCGVACSFDIASCRVRYFHCSIFVEFGQRRQFGPVYILQKNVYILHLPLTRQGFEGIIKISTAILFYLRIRQLNI